MCRTTRQRFASALILAGLLAVGAARAADDVSSKTTSGSPAAASQVVPASEIVEYPDHRPSARYRLDATDHGVIYRHATGPGQCDDLGARDVWVYESGGSYCMHYDGAGPKGWLACLATSQDLVTWTPKGPVLDFGAKGQEDSAGACYGVTYSDGATWHMFYLGTPHASPAPDLVPSFPYLTMKARSNSPAGPWTKQPEVVPFRCTANSYYDVTASPGHIIRQADDYLMFFSAASHDRRGTHRTLGIARTKDLNGPWAIDPEPLVAPEEQIENSYRSTSSRQTEPGSCSQTTSAWKAMNTPTRYGSIGRRI